jgi:uncharacterized protein YndB with AHSA1/START domain
MVRPPWGVGWHAVGAVMVTPTDGGTHRRAGAEPDYVRRVATTRLARHIRAPRTEVFRALLDARAVERWMVPDGMTSTVHVFEPHEGGRFRISLTYDAPTDIGKTSSQTDTFHGTFTRVIPDTEIVQVVEFETTDPALQGEMTITYALTDADDGTELVGLHEHLPPGLSPDENELGWSISVAKLARLVEQGE